MFRLIVNTSYNSFSVVGGRVSHHKFLCGKAKRLQNKNPKSIGVSLEFFKSYYGSCVFLKFVPSFFLTHDKLLGITINFLKNKNPYGSQTGAFTRIRAHTRQSMGPYSGEPKGRGLYLAPACEEKKKTHHNWLPNFTSSFSH